MGATLPILIRYYTDRASSAGASAGRVYSFNTLGAAVGTAVAGLVLVPFLGVMAGLAITAAMNLGIALAAWLAGAKA